MGVHSSVILSVRVPHKLRDQFRKKAEEYGPVADVHKELIEGFVDGRVSIQRKTKPIDKLYGDDNA